MKLISKLVHEKNQTMILVTHDENVAKYADIIVRISDGKIVSKEINDVENENKETKENKEINQEENSETDESKGE